jgi:hypothetical protein
LHIKRSKFFGIIIRFEPKVILKGEKGTLGGEPLLPSFPSMRPMNFVLLVWSTRLFYIVYYTSFQDQKLWLNYCHKTTFNYVLISLYSPQFGLTIRSTRSLWLHGNFGFSIDMHSPLLLSLQKMIYSSLLFSSEKSVSSTLVEIPIWQFLHK